MQKINAKQTEHDGFKFRSRLEAKWAEYFDILGIRYSYEPISFSIENNYLHYGYLPDFRLYNFRGNLDHPYTLNSYLWAEVKGVENEKELLKFKREDVQKVKDFHLNDDLLPIIILPNIPINLEDWKNGFVTTLDYVEEIHKPCFLSIGQDDNDGLGNDVFLCEFKSDSSYQSRAASKALQKAHNYIFD